MEGVWSVSRLIFAVGCAMVLALVGMTVLSTLNCLSSFVKEQLTVFVWVCSWVLYLRCIDLCACSFAAVIYLDVW